ncbi:AN1-type zinc finger protein 1 [Ceratobasidium sp. AG-Ba]|nr:AN1-type zinc finger protein 1 [Ceratobasidium sp. AG-Ba]
MDFSPAMATRKDSTDAQMLFVGSSCSHPSCNLVDFLPIRCDLCATTFCSDHFRPLDHQCPKYDHSKVDRVAPSCPLCSVPISIPVGQDPNLKMDAHIMNECPVMGNKRPAKSQAPRCASSKCSKVLIAPIRCNTCRKDFCPEHRFPQQHSCASQSSASIPRPAPSPVPQPVSSRLADKFSNISISGTRPGQSAASAKAAAAAMTRAATAPRPRPATTTNQPKNAPLQASASGASSSNKPAVPNPFNKTDRCEPNSPASPAADVVSAMDVDQPHKRPAPIESSYRPPPIFGFA